MLLKTAQLQKHILLILAPFAAAGAFAWLLGRGIPAGSAAIIAVCSIGVLACMLLLGTGDNLQRLQQDLIASPDRIYAIAGGLAGLYLAYALGTGTARASTMAVMTAYLAVPFLLLARRRDTAQATWTDMAAILWMWLPIEAGVIRALLVSSSNTGAFNYAFVQGLAIDMGLIAFAAWRRLPGIGYRFEFDRRAVVRSVLAFLVFAAAAIPLAFAIHFIQYSFELRKLLIAPAAFLGIYLTIAVPEELLFRGLIQNWCERMTASRWTGLLIASVIFGAAHLNNGQPQPNYRYFLMASIAGIFYGRVWQKTGRVSIAAITHALVDTAWSVFFR